MKLFIKNMVSLRCKLVVESELENLGLPYLSVELGEVDINGDVPDSDLKTLKAALLKTGLVLMDDKRSQHIEKIKNIVVEMVHYLDETPEMNFSDYVSEKMHMDYKQLSSLFSEVKGITIEQFIILHKIERVKEFLLYDEMNLTEIAYKLNYSSVAHLSNQFKKVTGLTPSFFKKIKHKRLEKLEEL